MTDKPHIYVGSLTLCSICLKGRAHQIHFFGVSPQNNPFQNKEVISDHLFTGTGDICTVCLKSKDVTVHSKVDNLTLYKSNGDKVAICDGHQCPMCKGVWNHDYRCGHRKQGLCTKCASDEVRQVNRKHDLELVEKEGNGLLTGQDFARINANSEVAIYKAIRDSSGELRSNWQEIIEARILLYTK